MKTVHTSNIYLSSDSGVKGSGTDFEVYLPAHGFTVNDGQFMRLTVQSMIGYKNFTNVNSTNNAFKLSFETTTDGLIDGWTSSQNSSGRFKYVSNTVYTIPEGDYPDIKSIGEALVEKLKTIFGDGDGGLAQGEGGRPIQIVNNTLRQSATDPIMTRDELKLEVTQYPIIKKQNIGTVYEVVLANTIGFLFYQVPGDPSHLFDTHLLLGGNNVNRKLTDVNVGLGMKAGVFTSPHRAHTTTLTHVYLRSSLVTDSHQNHHFDSAYSPVIDGHLTGSDILCRAPIHEDFFSFDDMNSVSTGYMINVANRSLTYMRFRLTTDKDLPLPTQEQVGEDDPNNTSVELVLRFDILEDE